MSHIIHGARDNGALILLFIPLHGLSFNLAHRIVCSPTLLRVRHYLDGDYNEMNGKNWKKSPLNVCGISMTQCDIDRYYHRSALLLSLSSSSIRWTLTIYWDGSNLFRCRYHQRQMIDKSNTISGHRSVFPQWSAKNRTNFQPSRSRCSRQKNNRIAENESEKAGERWAMR